ncbi:TRAP transporter small permease [Desulfosporosinus lacus]|uniref:TRAP-type C4-dicarboxylate transport system, small permease component n=1 Tax=Desulfosporosinus lacus DSM 15449 TaxID=1121420 RepID=A0A1M5YXE9_9FIRM|nr:TRAP transporter small permease [Desulfosporosinus lacus]SHI16508.1 TRAP-type C4-dicarboxylate transport system, small permease component [Desulfosporosinus lacus DSM 15449]
MGVVSKFAVKFSHILDLIARALVVAIMVLGVTNVITRFFGINIPGTIEWTEFLAAMVIGLSLAYCGAQSGHIFLELFTDKFPIKVQHWLQIVIDLLSMVFLSLSFWRIILYANDMKLSGQVSMTTKTPYYMFIYVVAFGLLAYALVTLGSMADSLRKGVQR